MLSYGVPRIDTITMAGMTIAPAAGVGEAINFQAADSGNVAITGDFVLTPEEVNQVLSELQGHHILVTALHSHMLTSSRAYFLCTSGLSAVRNRWATVSKRPWAMSP